VCVCVCARARVCGHHLHLAWVASIASICFMTSSADTWLFRCSTAATLAFRAPTSPVRVDTWS
jgi:hypothetical protein